MARDYMRPSSGGVRRTRASKYTDKYARSGARLNESRPNFKASSLSKVALRSRLSNRWNFSPRKSLDAIEKKSVFKVLLFMGALLMLVLTLAQPLRVYLQQGSALAAEDKKTTDLLAAVKSAEHKRQNMTSPQFYEVEARKQEQLVMPDETPYVITSPSPANPEEKSPATNKVGKKSAQDNWYTTLWNSVSK